MGLFRRRPSPAIAPVKPEVLPPQTGKTIHERIEVTVEREWMVVRGPAPSAGEQDGPKTVQVPEASRISAPGPFSDIASGAGRPRDLEADEEKRQDG